jgi:hypothetical protein
VLRVGPCAVNSAASAVQLGSAVRLASSIPPEQVERPSPRLTAHDYARVHRCPFRLTGLISIAPPPPTSQCTPHFTRSTGAYRGRTRCPRPNECRAMNSRQGRAIPVAQVAAPCTRANGARKRAAPRRSELTGGAGGVPARWGDALNDRCANSALTTKGTGQRLCLSPVPPVELPGIEPATEIELTCADADNCCAKRGENTHNDLRIRDRC